jgi:hypothetical protein
MKFFLMMLAAATVALAADNSITGTWDVQTEVMGNVGTAVCTLKQDGNKVTGKCTVEGVAQDVTGEIADQKVTFQHGGEYNGEALTITYSGTFESAASLTGEVNVKPFDVSGTFKAKKKE